MNPIYILLIVLGVAALVIGVVYIVMPYAIKRGLNVEGVLNTTNTVLQTVEAALDGVQLLLPDNAKLGIVAQIIDWSQEGAKAAEQMYKASLIAKEERNPEAKKIVYDCLAVAGIERTEQIDSIVSGMIEAAVLALPKAGE